MRLRHLGLILGLGDRNLFLTGLLIDFGLTGDTFDDVLIMDDTVLLDQQRGLIRIPLANDSTLRVFLALVDEEFGSVRDIESSQYDTGLLVLEVKGVLTADDDGLTGSGRDSTEVFDLDDSFACEGISTLCSSTSGQTTGVEGT